jgi:YVTN family beta-propeller protein
MHRLISREGVEMRRAACLIVVVLGMCPCAFAGSSNSLLDISADGKLLGAANRDNGTVSIVELATRTVLREIPVGNKPEGVTFLGATQHLAVAVYGDDKIVLLDAGSGDRQGEIEVFDEPYGVVSSADGSKLYVTLESAGDVVEIDVATRAVIRTLKAGAFPRGLALSRGGEKLFVTEYLTGAVVAIDLASGEVVDRWQGSPSENLARQVALHPTRDKAYVPHIRSRTNVNQGEGSIVPFVSVIDTAVGPGRRRKPVPMDSFVSVFVVANPWEVAVSPDGKTLLAVFAGTDDLYVCDVLDDNYRELSFRKVLNLGHNPRAARFAPDGERIYIYNTLDFTIVEYDTRTLKKQATIAVCRNPLGDEILRGKILFYTALQPMVGRRWISCASCHPDGDADGRTWQNPEGLRNTTPLYGMAWTHPIHWSADRDESQDFEHTIRGRLMQGQGLIRGPVAESLAEPNKGRSPDLDALAAYCNMHKTPLSPHAKRGLSDAARRGRALFLADETGCAACHAGPYYTDSTPKRPYRLHDVGTGTEDPTEQMGPAYDTPTLLSIYRTAPYLHDGRAATLEEVLTKFNRDDRHGKTSHLSREQIDDLVEFLKALPYEDPEPQAKASGLIKIEK